jgi:hypothetical protein
MAGQGPLRCAEVVKSQYHVVVPCDRRNQVHLTGQARGAEQKRGRRASSAIHPLHQLSTGGGGSSCYRRASPAVDTAAAFCVSFTATGPEQSADQACCSVALPEKLPAVFVTGIGCAPQQLPRLHVRKRDAGACGSCGAAWQLLAAVPAPRACAAAQLSRAAAAGAAAGASARG